MPEKTKCRVLIIGLDGADPDLIGPWSAAGALPHLGRLIESGAWGPLRSTIPPVTAPAWVSFMTGKNPGKHGVYNFRNFDLRNYAGTGRNAKIASSATYAGQSIFEIVSAAGGSVASINMPVTYPPFPVNGVIISGLPVLPDFRRPYTFPSELARDIGPWSRNRETLDRLSSHQRLEAVDFWTEKHTNVALDLLADGSWDVFAFVLRNTDAVPHYFWKYHDPAYRGVDQKGRKEYGGVVKDHYRKADAAVGQLVEAVNDDTIVLVLSDHGMGAHPQYYYHINRWLADLGILTPKPSSRGRESVAGHLSRVKDLLPRRVRMFVRSHLPTSAEERIFRVLLNVDRVDWGKTRAYRVPIFPLVDGIEINVRGRQPEGIVDPGQDYERLRERLIEELTSCRDPKSGQPIVEAVYRREDVYEGPYVSEAPDLLVLFQPSFTGGAGLDGPVVTDYDESLNHWSGAHRMDGVLIVNGGPIRKGAKPKAARIEDVAPTVLYALDLPVPEDMDGRVLRELFTQEFLDAHPIRSGGGSNASGRREAMTVDEEEQISRQLKGLGYL